MPHSSPGDEAAPGIGKGGSVTKLSTGAAAAFEKSTPGGCSSPELRSSNARRDLLKLPLSDPLCHGLCESCGAGVRAALLSSCACRCWQLLQTQHNAVCGGSPCTRGRNQRKLQLLMLAPRFWTVRPNIAPQRFVHSEKQGNKSSRYLRRLSWRTRESGEHGSGIRHSNVYAELGIRAGHWLSRHIMQKNLAVPRN